MRTSRRGTIYIITLGMSLIVATLATAGLLAVRAQRSQTGLFEDTVQARLNAQSSLEMALLRLEETGNWRADIEAIQTSVANATSAEITGFTAVDEDGNVADDPLDDIVITAVGVSGPATQKVQVRLKARQPGLRCLEPVIHSHEDIVLDSTRVGYSPTDGYSNRMVSSNRKIRARVGSQIYNDAEAKDEVTATDGSVFHADTTTEGVWPREMPDKATVLDYYLNNGTQIDINDLPFWGAEQLVNPDMGNGTDEWVDYGCDLVLDADASQTPWSLRVRNRSSDMAGPVQYMPDAIQSGETYALSADVKSYVGPMWMRIELYTRIDETDVDRFETAWFWVDSSFSTIQGNVTPEWTGTLTDACVLVRSAGSTYPFKIDDASLRVADTPPDCRVIHRVLLSPTNNPYGVGTTNPQGIYVIQCNDATLWIKDCRIVGTLVLMDHDQGSSLICGSVNWTSAVEPSRDHSVTNLPILLSDRDLHFSTTGDALNEGLVNADLGDPSAPGGFNGDSDKEDEYPSIFQGIIYTQHKILVNSAGLRIHGCLVSHRVMSFDDSDVTATYDPVYYWYNAPPGFRVDPVMELDAGSFLRVVD